MRFLANAIGSVLLAFAMVFAVADIVDVFGLAGLSLEPAAGQSEAAKATLSLISAWPASVALGIAAFVFLFIGRRRSGRRARPIR